VTDSSGGSPTTGRAMTGVVDLRDAFRMVGSAWEAAHRRGGELGRWLGHGQDFKKLRITNAIFIGGEMT
jgi:hypothetical protein